MSRHVRSTSANNEKMCFFIYTNKMNIYVLWKMCKHFVFPEKISNDYIYSLQIMFDKYIERSLEEDFQKLLSANLHRFYCILKI